MFQLAQAGARCQGREQTVLHGLLRGEMRSSCFILNLVLMPERKEEMKGKMDVDSFTS